ncbi:hypothetical protein CMUS01_06102 [Colletotrichum musicola]|uniref:Uncharacterized protein n=1 Tax=Colletotrichum musicola TaxID=2175873 RepID=A0A8H6KNS2_9PEZI|nr:hypothetical protein CMUS01_06102 [Colletotrichum musicola]
MVDHFFCQYPSLRIPEWNGDSPPREAGEILPNLEPFALSKHLGHEPLSASMISYLLSYEDAVYDRLQPKTLPKRFDRLTELRVAGSETGILLFPIHGYDHGSNITSITLRDIVAKQKDVAAFVRPFKGLRVFRYFGVDHWMPEDTTDMSPATADILSATSVIKALRRHVKTLKTFCYGTELHGNSDWDIFEDFVSLENLWVSSHNFVGRLAQNTYLEDDALGRLPSSLKRLHIAGYITPLLPALSGLAALRRNNGAMPNLEEVAFKFSRWELRYEPSWESRLEPPSEDGWEYTPESRWDADARLLSVEALGDFQELGVRALDQVNQLPGSW